MLKDLYTLITQELRYLADKETLCELPLVAHDLLLGAKRKPKEQNFTYMDLHAHFRKTENIRDIINEASKRVDVLSIVTWAKEYNNGEMSFSDALEKLEQEKVEHHKIGERIVVINRSDDRPFYLLRATETYVKENQGVVMVGTDKEFSADSLTLDDAINEATEMNSFYFLDHPFSIGVPVIGFRYPTEEELKLRQKWFDKYNPVIEIHNHQNTLWMFPSNILAKKMAQKHNLVGIANSDTHFGITDVGLSRTVIPSSYLDNYSEEAFLKTLKNALSMAHYDNIKVESGYSSIWSFGKNMILPRLIGRH
ncbi:MAG: PHP-associated domain-containing protein [Nanoarchaeota archaeon]|nr:PHP-associated domain-containing protein [Nanoarchaeota archaeon]